MPPRFYLLIHPEAPLADTELAALANGLAATFGDEGEGDEGEGQKDRDQDDDDG